MTFIPSSSGPAFRYQIWDRSLHKQHGEILEDGDEAIVTCGRVNRSHGAVGRFVIRPIPTDEAEQ